MNDTSQKRKTKILVAMSGGVDSSVAAGLLTEQGYDVVGVFMRLGAEAYSSATPEPELCSATRSSTGISLPLASAMATPAVHHSKGCCSAADAHDARRVAGKLGIPFYALNFEEDFRQLIDYFVDEYANARTPNPCIRCNQWLKFGRLISFAEGMGAELIATGHYARIDQIGDRPRLRRAICAEKDQSYVLFGVRAEILRRTLFPLGEMTKQDVRAHARRMGLALHDKPESQDICFVPDGNYARLVRSRRSGAFRPGEIRHVDGRVLGTHSGLANYTIGQRRGLNVAVGTPVYVSALDAKTDTVFVGPREALLSRSAHVRGVQWLCSTDGKSLRAEVQIRYHHTAAPARVLLLSEDVVRVEFDEPQSAITPGQAAVFYRGDEVLGGGWIDGED